MKTKCDFCKTEYSLDTVPAAPVQCAVCGHCWMVARRANTHGFLMVLAAVCALMSAAIFTAVVIMHHRANQIAAARPLVATVESVRVETDDNNTRELIVTGRVSNRSDDIYGVPDIMVIATDANGNVLMRQKVLPPATLLDSGMSVEFRHKISTPPTGVRSISVELANEPENGGKK